MNGNGSFGNWLKQRRKALDLTQVDLAGQVGCSVITIQTLEADKRRPSKQITERLADALAIATDERAAFVTFARRSQAIPPSLPVATSAAALHNLPAQPTAFIGRTDELAQISQRLNNPACRLLTLVGQGGVGKTRLALEAARTVIDNFAHGVHFVSLAPINTPDQIAATIVGTLKIVFHGAEDPGVQLLHHLRDKAMLLVVDNFEHVIEGVGLLTDVLASTTRVKLLVTSRERLNVQEEWVFGVEGLSYPDKREADQPEDYSAVQLFIQRTRQVQATFSAADNMQSIIDICRAVEGMPLGIELAASWVRMLPCARIAEKLAVDLDALASPLRNVPDRHRSLRSVFDHSWGLLSRAEQAVLARLSVFRGGFDLDDAEHVAGASLALLASLVDKSLIRTSESGRYDLHELLRQYAQDRLNAAGEADSTAYQHLIFFLGIAEQAELFLYSSHQVAWHDRLETEHDNLRAALGWSLVSQHADIGLRLAAALEWFWHMRYHWSEGQRWLTTMLDAADDASARVRAKALHRAGDLAVLQHMEKQAEVFYRQALALARQNQDTLDTAWALSGLGVVLAAKGSPDNGIAFIEEAVVLFRSLEDPWGLNHALARLSWSCLAQPPTDLARSKALLQEALALARAAGVKSAIAWALVLLGDITGYYENTDHAQAAAMLQEGLVLFREAHCSEGVSYTLSSVGVMFLLSDDYERAEEYFEEQLNLERRQGTQVFQAEALRHLGRVAQARGEHQRAHALFEQSLTIEREVGNKLGIEDTLTALEHLDDENGPETSKRHLLRNDTLISWIHHNFYRDADFIPRNLLP